MTQLTPVTAPASEPVTLAEAKIHLRVDIGDDDALIARLISAARQLVEGMAGRTLYTTTWRLTLDGWPAVPYIELPRPPLQSVSSVTYVDVDGNSNTMPATDYVVETERTPGRIHLAYGATWPSTGLRPASPISITYVAGWADTDDIPDEYKQAILLLVAHWYENREAVIVGGAVPKVLELAVQSLVLSDRVW